ncbi:MAG: hypothetical protein ACT4QF_11200 [Sporichthyaceae bacterium]
MTFDEQEWDADQGSALHRWLTAWVGIGVAIVAVVAIFLVLIGNSLGRIDENLAAADVAVDNVSGSAQALPDQVDRVNRSLAVVEAALQVLPRDTESIAENLSRIVEALQLIEADLGGAAPKLATTADNLEASATLVGPIGVNLEKASALLERILASTGGMHASLQAIDGKGRTGIVGVRANLATVNRVLTAVRGDLGDILSTNGRINGHLERVCKSPAVGLRGGPQPC